MKVESGCREDPVEGETGIGGTMIVRWGRPYDRVSASGPHNWPAATAPIQRRGAKRFRPERMVIRTLIFRFP